jgi:hypothetical protein
MQSEALLPVPLPINASYSPCVYLNGNWNRISLLIPNPVDCLRYPLTPVAGATPPLPHSGRGGAGNPPRLTRIWYELWPRCILYTRSALSPQPSARKVTALRWFRTMHQRAKPASYPGWCGLSCRAHGQILTKSSYVHKMTHKVDACERTNARLHGLVVLMQEQLLTIDGQERCENHALRKCARKLHDPGTFLV